jgi:hypothetical protein
MIRHSLVAVFCYRLMREPMGPHNGIFSPYQTAASAGQGRGRAGQGKGKGRARAIKKGA